MDLTSPMWFMLEPVIFAGTLLGLRMLGLVLALPGLATGGAFPAPTRMLFVLFLTTFCYSTLGMPIVPLPTELFVAAPMLVREFLIGSALGLSIKMTLHVAEAAGSIASNMTSLSMASMVDPTTGQDSTALGNLLSLFGMMLFITLDGHHHAIAGLIDNLALFPLGGHAPVGFNVSALVQMGQGLFLAAVKVAAPVMLVTGLVNVGLGMMARAAPQLSIFNIGFGVAIMVGLSFFDRSVVSLSEMYEDTIPKLAQTMNADLVRVTTDVKP